MTTNTPAAGTDDRPVVAITGGASGIGLEVARGWIQEEGGRAVLIDLSPASLERACAELGPAARGVRADVTDTPSIAEAYATIATQEGRLDAVVNSAGVSWPAPSAEIPNEKFAKLIDIHVNGTHRSAQAAYPLLLRSNRAAIVNLSSVAATVGMPQRAAYCAGKAGIDGLTRALAVEWAPLGIRVNAVAPGYVETALVSGLVERGELNLERVIARTPLRRLAAPEEIAGLILFMISTRASYVTGQTVIADGGLTVDGNWY